MEPIEKIREVMQGKYTVGIALAEIEEELGVFQTDMRTLQKLRQARRFFLRWRSYEIRHTLTDQDFLLTLRDTILHLGKFPVTPKVQQAVVKYGEDYGLFQEISGEISARLSRPGWFPNDHFVRQCYGVDEYTTFERPQTAGDCYLYETTGFKTYKSFEQKIAVHTALHMPEGYTLLVTLSTGEGKSTITQMSAATEDGLNILVVPTTALGKDQVRAARMVLKKTIAPEAIYDFCGEFTGNIQDLRERINRKEVRLLVTSPEAIVKNISLRKELSRAAENGYLKRLIIDEVHIVQDWGATFRPDFQFLSVIRRELFEKTGGKLKTVLLSATLTESAVGHLQELFSESKAGKSNWIPIRCDSLRTEIRYMVDPVTNTDHKKEEQKEKILRYVRTLPKPMLIYTIKPKEAEEWKTFLSDHGIRNTATFTGLTGDDERTEIIRKWSEDEIDIVLATSAFGMGIDKADVRTVIHAVMPESLNRFYQEVGRGGRDGLPSISLLCYCPATDHHQQVNITHKKIMTWDRMKQRWEKMAADPLALREADTIELNTRTAPDYFDEAEKEYCGNRNRDWNLHTILFMVRHGLIKFLDIRYIPESGDYYVKVRMLDAALKQDQAEFNRIGETGRKAEYDATDQELRIFQEMVKDRDHKCFAESLVSVYPLTDFDCGGCAQHNREAFSSSGEYRLHLRIESYELPGEKELPYKIWHDTKCLIIGRTDETDPELAAQVANKLQRTGIHTWIQAGHKSLYRKAEVFRGLVLSLTEARLLLSQHPAILGKAVLITLGENDRENQRLLEFGNSLINQGLAVALHMRPDTVYAQTGKTLDQSIMSRRISENELK